MNHSRRAHPAVIRAALRLHNHQIKQADGSATYTYDSKQLRQIGESVTYATNGAPFTMSADCPRRCVPHMRGDEPLNSCGRSSAIGLSTLLKTIRNEGEEKAMKGMPKSTYYRQVKRLQELGLLD